MIYWFCRGEFIRLECIDLANELAPIDHKPDLG